MPATISAPCETEAAPFIGPLGQRLEMQTIEVPIPEGWEVVGFRWLEFDDYFLNPFHLDVRKQTANSPRMWGIVVRRAD